MTGPAGPAGEFRFSDTGFQQRVDPGDPVYDRVPGYDPRAGDHYWVITMVHRVDPVRVTTENHPDGPTSFDRETLVMVAGPGCLYCEQPYTPRLLRRRCPGDR